MLHLRITSREETWQCEVSCTNCSGEFVDGQKLSSWRTELDEYLESSSTEPFYKGGLILNEKEIDQLKLELDDLSNIMYSVTSSELKVMKGC